jgi:uncharacterized protein YhaN
MRIERLDLTRYGVFTDHVVDFGERPAGAPDLHLVYGPNEAGKSTTLSAVLDLLYGIEPRSRYGFRHPYPNMQLGGRLEIAGRAQELIRIKRPQNSLLDARRQPLPDTAALAELGGIDRDAYRAMFSLDDDTLEAGGDSILKSEGDLGALLFSASAGLAELGRKLGALGEDADAFYKRHGRNNALGRLKTQLAELKQQRDAADTAAGVYAGLIAARETAAKAYDAAMTERAALRSRLDAIGRALAALPRLAELRALRAAIEPLAHVPAAPLGWAEALPKLRDDEIALATQSEALRDAIDGLAREREAVIVDARLPPLAERIARFLSLRSRFDTAVEDIPKLEAQRREIDGAVAALLARLECPTGTDPAGLRLAASTTGALRALAEQRSGVEAKAGSAREALEEAELRLEQATVKLTETSGDSGRPSEAALLALAAALAAARADDHAVRRRSALRALDGERRALGEMLPTLAPWTGSLEALREMRPPQRAAVERCGRALAEAEQALSRHDGELVRLGVEERRLSAEIEALSASIGVVGDGAAAELRARREEAWATHKRRLDASTAADFEDVLRRDDLATASRLVHAAEAAELTQLGRTLAMRREARAVEGEKRSAAAAARDQLRGELAGMVAALSPSLPQDWRPEQILTFLEARTKAIELLRSIDTGERELAEAEADGEALRRRLADALDAAGVAAAKDAPVVSLASAAQAHLDRMARVDGLRRAVEDGHTDVERLRRACVKAEAAVEAWDAAWTAACRGCWLGAGGETPTVAAVGEILPALARLEQEIEKRAGLTERIDKMERDQRRFAEEAAGLATALALAPSADPRDIAVRIERAARDWESAVAARSALDDKLTAAFERRSALAEALTVIERRKAEMLEHFSAASLVEVDTALRALERRTELETRARAIEQDLLGTLGAPDIGVAAEALDGLDRAAAETERNEIAARLDDLDRHAQELHTAHARASERVEAVGGDDAVARIEERRRTILLEIEDGARQYLRLRLGIAAVERALQIYRDQHRSSMMASASDAFRMLTRGAYKALTSRPDRAGEVLVALTETDSKLATELSKGARFQLYLALRFAGYREFVRARAPVPFLADDIMETFDDFRAEEAFRLLAEMATVGQVIYLTHHRHLCDIARAVCPSVRVHALA